MSTTPDPTGEPPEVVVLGHVFTAAEPTGHALAVEYRDRHPETDPPGGPEWSWWEES